ncbi:glycosyltransferase family 4 protein [Kamptonema cortianum]|uniref:Glycosyltransferase family 4 protein n=1 Tax=Geitlerinema calcuttense NRMC-F 0142 TaxID=2922238 RepID=A0ABT7LY87_9CYAN|nr:glycosyltransferase family 4 protein [Geitlerinema calcuttense]MDK3157452.1 glycosyltransferase family 4 protein [Kamptonema cortianum]MDL5056982.1 glycosyltransferase family 4 protein [Geitlerinema calcuttense NRMC-F 0142]
MNRPLKILMVLHMPWNRNLGGPRVQLELADEFQAMGHHVEKFDCLDAFPQPSNSRIASLLLPSFSTKAKQYVQANAHRFDIIDAHQGNLPFSKQELGIQGLLVARSVGLFAFLQEFLEFEKKQWPQQKRGNPIGRLIRAFQQQREQPSYLQSLQACDLINVPNEDEKIYLQQHWGLGHKCQAFPFGLTQKRQAAFVQAIQPVTQRLEHQQVAFIGYWCNRKGSRDWGAIIQGVRAKLPDTKFLFLGTGVSEEVVLQDLNLPNSQGIEVIPSYDSDELPKLLSGATVGAFPSYMEGFGFGVLEKLACGLPSVAYDIPGPRAMLKPLDAALMVPVGNVEAFTAKLVQILQLDEIAYSQLSERCGVVAETFSWSRIAKDHLDVYSQELERLNASLVH